MNIYLATGAVLLVYLIFVWFLGNILHLHGRDIWVLRIGLGVIGIIGAGVFLWFKRREQKLAAGEGSQDTGGPGHEEIDALIRDADVVIQNGVGLEKWLKPTIDSAAPRGEIVDASKGVKVRAGKGAGEKEGDPHIWFAPANAKIMVANVTKALVAADPPGAPTYEANQRAYDTQLDALT